MRRTPYVLAARLLALAGVWMGIHFGSYSASAPTRMPAVQHSGSVRYYAHRITERWDLLAPGALDAVLRELTEKGYRPYIVIDDQEA